MHFASSFGWRDVLHRVLVIAAALLLAQAAHYVLYTSLRKAHKWHNTFDGGEIIRYTSGPALLLLYTAALSIALPSLALSVESTIIMQQILRITDIAAVTWVIVSLIEIANAVILNRVPNDVQGDIRARRIRTQVQLLRQIAIGLFVFVGFAAILMTFPPIRNIGAGLFASAGVAGLVLGMAARPTLGNLIAGIQIALTEPIRINDSVLVEGEFGQVVEVNTTYVVIRLWDLRHMIVPISHFIEKSFQNWTRYSSELIGAVYLEVDYSVPIKQIREHYAVVLRNSPLWDGNTMTVQVTDAAHSCVQIRLLMSAQNPTITFDLRCYVREEMLAFLQSEYPDSLPKVRSDVTVARAPSSRLHR